MKNIFKIFVLLNFCLLAACSNYKKFPKEFHNHDNLFKDIIPDKRYTYWECINTNNPQKPVFSRGKKPEGIKFDSGLFNGFFRGCMPVMCVTYIAYINNGKIGYATNAKELKDFLGTIDNIQEAVLLAEVSQNLDITDLKEGGSYYLQADKYHLKLSNVTYCPKTIESIYVCIQRDSGVVSKKNLGILQKTEDCMIF